MNGPWRVWLLLSVLLVAPGTARADSASQARFFDDAARDAYERGDYEDALELFLLSHRAAASPRTLYNVAVCSDLGGYEAEAFVFFEEYLRSGDDSDGRRAEAQRRMDALREKLSLVRVTSEPPGATIYIDRRELGTYGRTPRTIVVQPGEHEVRLELPGYLASSVQVEAEPAEEAAVRLELEPHTGSLFVETPRGSATLAVLHGVRTIAEGPAGEPLTVPVGSYRLRVEAPGHQPLEERVVVHENARTRRYVVLEPVRPRTGRLLVATGDVHARVIVDGQARAETPATLRGLQVGEHALRVEASGYRPWEGRIEIRNDETAYLNVTLLRTP